MFDDNYFMNDFLKLFPRDLAERMNDPAAPREAWTPQLAFEVVAAGLQMATEMAVEATDLWDGTDPKSCPLFIRTCLLRLYPVLLRWAELEGLDVPDWVDYRGRKTFNGNPFSSGVEIAVAKYDHDRWDLRELRELLEIQRARDEETDNE